MATNQNRLTQLRHRHPTLLGGEIDWEANPRHRENIARKAAVKQRLFEPYVAGRRVLHIGAGGGNVGRPDDDTTWFHGWLDAVAHEAVGIDVDEEAVRAAQAAGYDVRQADAQVFDVVDESFPVVVAPNLIEHLANPGLMLTRARAHLDVSGKLLITTPRANTPWFTVQEILGDGSTPDEHTMWFCRDTLETLLERCGFDLAHYETWGFDRLGMSPTDRCWRLAERALERVPGFGDVAEMQQFAVAEPREDRL